MWSCANVYLSCCMLLFCLLYLWFSMCINYTHTGEEVKKLTGCPLCQEVS